MLFREVLIVVVAACGARRQRAQLATLVVASAPGEMCRGSSRMNSRGLGLVAAEEEVDGEEQHEEEVREEGEHLCL